MKTTTLIIASFLLFLNCGAKTEKISSQKTFPVKIQNVYFQHWVAGVRGGGSGTGFYIEFIEKLPKDIVLNQLYFRNKKAPIVAANETTYLANFPGEGNNKEPEMNETDDSSKDVKKDNIIKPPFSIQENEAIIEYTIKGQKKLFKLKDAKEKEMLAYPSARPRN